MKNHYIETIEKLRQEKNRLQQENQELKKQLSSFEEWVRVKGIIPTKERIVEVLKQYQIREIEKFTKENKGKERCVWDRTPEQIASEILGDDIETESPVMPPKREYEVNVVIDKIEKGKPSKVGDGKNE
jgi:glutamyl-tRNA reductase